MHGFAMYIRYIYFKASGWGDIIQHSTNGLMGNTLTNEACMKFEQVKL